MEKSFFDKGWELRREAQARINHYCNQQTEQVFMDGKIIVTYEANFDGLQAKCLMQVCKGHVWVSDFDDDEEEAWEQIEFQDIMLHSLLNIADAVLQGENRK